MRVDLDTEDLINLVLGVVPNHNIMNKSYINPYGYFSDNNGWDWCRSSLGKLPQSLLYTIYKSCKASWKK